MVFYRIDIVSVWVFSNVLLWDNLRKRRDDFRLRFVREKHMNIFDLSVKVQKKVAIVVTVSSAISNGNFHIDAIKEFSISTCPQQSCVAFNFYSIN